MPRNLPANLRSFRRTWWFCHALTLALYFLCGTILVVLPILVGSGYLGPATDRILAFAVAITAGLSALFRFDRTADNYHAAWRMLNVAAIKYENEDDFPIAEVTEAYARGERLIEASFAPEEPKSHDRPPK